MNSKHCCRYNHVHGFTLIEIMIAVAIIGILAATSIPTYRTFIKQARLVAAEMNLINALKEFSFSKEYSPASGMLADLVVENYLTAIPNDPWTDAAAGASTGAEEVADWYYENDGTQLYLYAKSRPGRLYTLPSLGQPPLSPDPTPPAPTPPDPTPPAPTLPATMKEARAQASQLKDAAKAQAKQLEKDAKAAGKDLSKSAARQLEKDAKAAGNQLKKDAKAAADQLIKDTKASLQK